MSIERILQTSVSEGNGYGPLPQQHFSKDPSEFMDSLKVSRLILPVLATGAFLSACTGPQKDNFAVGTAGLVLNTGLTYLNLSTWFRDKDFDPGVKLGLSVGAAVGISIVAGQGVCLGTAGLIFLEIMGGVTLHNQNRKIRLAEASNEVSEPEDDREEGEE